MILYLGKMTFLKVERPPKGHVLQGPGSELGPDDLDDVGWPRAEAAYRLLVTPTPEDLDGLRPEVVSCFGELQIMQRDFRPLP